MPFGVNYNGIDKQKLATTLAIRGAYEEAFLLKCLAEAKNTLKQAEQK